MNQVKQYPCGSCGANLEYEPGTTALKCDYCGHENPISDQGVPDAHEEKDFATALKAFRAAEQDNMISAQVVKCDSCAAEFTLEANVTASECPFCGSAVVAEAAETVLFKPQGLLPFKFEDKQARRLFKDYIDGLWFAPSALTRKSANDTGISGIYVPYWTFDANTVSYYKGERGEDYQETYTDSEGKQKTRTKTRWYTANGVVRNGFDDVLVVASESLPKPKVDALEPWDLDNLAGFSDSYLSGFQAERYTVDPEKGFEDAKGKMESTIRDTIRRDIGGDRQRVHSVDTRHFDVTFKHVLLPIYASSYRFKDKVYQFVVNGRTGEVQAERPYSVIKILAAVAVVAAVIGGAIYLLG